MFDKSKIVDIEVDGIDYKDYPDFVDAFICNASLVLESGEVRQCTDEELDELNKDSELVYNLVIKHIF